MKIIALPVLGLLLLSACSATGPFSPLDSDKKDKLGVSSDISAMVGFGFGSYDTYTDGAPEFDGDTDEEDTTFQLGLSAKVHPQVSLELAYVDLGSFSWDGLWEGTPSEGSVDTTGFRLGATGEWPIRDSDWSYIATGGLLFSDQDTEEVFGGSPEPDINESGTDLYLGGGVQYRFTDLFAGRITLTRTFGVHGDDIDVLMFDLLYGFK